MDVGAPAVIAAIHDATGAWIHDLPATPERILAALAGIDPPRPAGHLDGVGPVDGRSGARHSADDLPPDRQRGPDRGRRARACAGCSTSCARTSG